MKSQLINIVQRLISPGLIKALWIMPLCPKTSAMAKVEGRKVDLPGVKPRAIGSVVAGRSCSSVAEHLAR